MLAKIFDMKESKLYDNLTDEYLDFCIDNP